MKCTSCGMENADNAVRCAGCNAAFVQVGAAPAPVTSKCPSCGSLLGYPTPSICPSCSQPLAASTGVSAFGSPARQPWYARLSEQRIPMMALVPALVLTLVLTALLSATVRPASFCQRMFVPGGVLNSVPFAINLLFFWSATILAMRALRMRFQVSLLNSPVIGEVGRLIAMGDEKSASQMLKSRGDGGILCDRMHRILDQWLTDRSIEHAENSAIRQAERDSDTVSAGYSSVRVFVWAMPVLGFIGTVIGISMAVGQFSGFLGGEITNLEAVKKQLVSVTNGLSFAFLTTLHGLLGALFAMLPASSLQKSEDDLLNDIDSCCTDGILSRLSPAGVAAPGGPITVDVSQQLEKVLEKHMPAAAAWEERMEAVVQAMLQKLGDGTVEIGTGIRQSLRDEAASLGETMSQIQEGLISATRTCADQLTAIETRMAQDMERSVSALSEEGRRSEQLLQEYCSRFEQTARLLSDLTTQTQQVADLHAKLDKTVDEMQAVQLLLSTLQATQETLQSVRPLISRLGGPLELRLVPQDGGS